MKLCSKCKGEVEQSRISQRYCKGCHNAHMKATRPKHSQMKSERRLKANARAYTNEYIRRGKLVKSICVCGNTNVEAHHEDYSKPLEVVWLCRSCHMKRHVQNN